MYCSNVLTVDAHNNKQAVDYHVVRYPGAVSWFAPGSYASRPPLQTCIPNLVCAGDWVSITMCISYCVQSCSVFLSVVQCSVGTYLLVWPQAPVLHLHVRSLISSVALY
jgi:uncharacterized protein with NAD-binding domain and iron-sulfur cluster